MKDLKYPSMDDYYKAFIAADADFDKADNTKLAGYEMMFAIKNSRLRGHILTRRTAVASWDWSIVPYDPKDAEIAKEAELRLRRIINKIIPARINTALYGFYAVDIEFILDETTNQRMPVIRSRYKPDNVIAVSDDSIKVREGDAETTKTKQSLLNIGGNINPVVTIIETDGEDYRGGILASVGVNEILRITVLNEYIAFLQKLKGVIHAIDEGADEGEREALENAVQNVIQHNYLVTSKFVDVKFQDIVNASSGQSFNDVINEFNNAIAIAILGQANTPELPKNGGSRAAVQVQQLVSADIRFNDVIKTLELINDQLLPFDYYFNKNLTVPPYEFRINLAEQVDYESNSVVVTNALSSRVPLKKSEVYSKIGFSVPMEGEETIQGEGL